VQRTAKKVKGATSAQREREQPDLSGARLLLVAFGVFASLAAGIAAIGLERPGLYYDEVVQAVPALEFLSADGRPSALPGARTIRLLGGWFPVMTQPYMGALKSQLLIPTFAVAEASATSLRATTLVWSLVGLLLVMLWARRALGLCEALLVGALLCVDPSFLFVSRHDWGSFALGFLCRGGALLLLYAGWRARSPLRLAAGGLFLGLGLYNKIDFALFPLAAGTALLATAPETLREALLRRRRELLAACAGALLGAAPLLTFVGGAVGATRMSGRTLSVASPDWGEKLQTFTTMLDGSHFHRLMLAGGSFERLGATEGAASGPFLALFALATVALAVALARDARRGQANRAHAFVLLATLLLSLGIFITPRAVRIHHFLNLMPFPQLVVAIAVAGAWRRARGALPRTTVALLLIACIAGSLRVDVHTLRTIHETGGRGRWSDAIGASGRELRGRPAAVAVSLDWGFDGPLRVAAPGLETDEPIWRLRAASRAAPRSVSLDGSPAHVYFVFEDEYAVFPFGAQLLAALEAKPAGFASVDRHSDRLGGPAYLTVRIPFPHELVYRGDLVEVRRR